VKLRAPSDAVFAEAEAGLCPMRRLTSNGCTVTFGVEASRSAQRIELSVRSPRSVECILLTKARKRLIQELARWQIPIESNPSSNLVVASLDAMSSQDFLAQTVERAREAGHETLPWTISTDDPITFATSLADEYAYAWAGMVLREKNPYDPAHARALLDQAAATSMRTRFTVPQDDG
jgi:adenosine deaminase